MLKMGQSRPLFVYFRSFLITISLQIEKSNDDVLGIRTRGRRMEGADNTTELWRPPKKHRCCAWGSKQGAAGWKAQTSALSCGDS